MADYIENMTPQDGKVRKIYPRMTLEKYESLDENERGELINGRFYDMASSGVTHQRMVGFIYRTIGNYIESNSGHCEAFTAPLDVRLFSDEETVLQPDILVVCDPGRTGDKYIDGAPDLVIEVVSPTNPGHDYVRKLDLYIRAGVREYWIVDPDEKKVVVYMTGVDDGKDVTMQIYSFNDDIPVHIYDGNLTISLADFD